MTLLQLENITCARPVAGGKSRQVLKDVSLTLEEGELLVLIGRSGGGKTTLLRLLNRLEEPDSGQIAFGGRGLGLIPPAELRRTIVMMTQRPVMFPGSVRDNLLLPLRLAKVAIGPLHESQLLEALKACQLSQELINQNASELSVGQQQRVALARALVLEPSVLVADEPTSALDRPTARLVARALRDYAHAPGRAAVMVSHDLELARNYADRILFLDEGQIVEEGPPGALLKDPQSVALQQFLASPREETMND